MSKITMCDIRNCGKTDEDLFIYELTVEQINKIKLHDFEDFHNGVDICSNCFDAIYNDELNLGENSDRDVLEAMLEVLEQGE